METIYIPNLLKAKERKQTIPLDYFVPGLETLTPVRGTMVIRHGGTFLEISVQGETILTLTCDRCLQQYNHRLALETSELIWLDENADKPQQFPQEREVTVEDLSETLSPDGHFSPDTWLYEQLSLAMPLRKLCGKSCQPPIATSLASKPVIDSRWSSLEAIKNKLS